MWTAVAKAVPLLAWSAGACVTSDRYLKLCDGWPVLPAVCTGGAEDHFALL